MKTDKIFYDKASKRNVYSQNLGGSPKNIDDKYASIAKSIKTCCISDCNNSFSGKYRCCAECYKAGKYTKNMWVTKPLSNYQKGIEIKKAKKKAKKKKYPKWMTTKQKKKLGYKPVELASQFGGKYKKPTSRIRDVGYYKAFS